MGTKAEKLTNKNDLGVLGKQVAPIIFQTITALSSVNPVWGVLFMTAMGVINAWGDFGQKRVNELVQFISDHRGEFVKEIIASDKFKTLFLNILERHMKEASEEKRKLLRTYLLSVGKGVNSEFSEDDFTRMNSVIDSISFTEIDMLRLWDEGGCIQQWIDSSEPHIRDVRREMSMTISTIGDIVRKMKYNSRLDFSSNGKQKNNCILFSLGFKGLLYVLGASSYGSGQEATVVTITEFGKAFLNFIKAE